MKNCYEKMVKLATVLGVSWALISTVGEQVGYADTSCPVAELTIDENDYVSCKNIEKTVETPVSISFQISDGEMEKDGIWEAWDGMPMPYEDGYILYVRLQDTAGNACYVSTKSLMVQPETASANGVYNTNVNVRIIAENNIANDKEIPITNIQYTLTMGDKSETISPVRNNSTIILPVLEYDQDVEMKTKVTDKAGNRIYKINKFYIDTNKPKIFISYDNNNTQATNGSVALFNQNRTATISITERNFRKETVALTIRNTYGSVPELSEWVTSENGETHTATLTFRDDGEYTLGVSYTDAAGNMVNQIEYGDSVAPERFIIDKTAPVLAMTYDNNEATEENYYKADRVATITMRERHFDASKVQLQIEAEQTQPEAVVPTIENWSSNGDNHTAQIRFVSDGKYKVQLSYTDAAGNQGTAVNDAEFYLDKTSPEIKIKGIMDGSANKTEGNIGFTLECMDENLVEFKPVLRTSVRTENGIEETEIEGVITEEGNKKYFTIENIEEDGIYTLQCKASDKAGNRYNQIYLLDKNGQEYTEARAEGDDLIMFSVNRNGSSYVPSEEVLNLVKNYYVKEVEGDLLITEINPDELNEYKVMVNGTVLVEGTDYKVKKAKESIWNEYQYVIYKSVFETEGEYSISLESVDKTNRVSFSDVKNLDVTFVVDKTPPVVELMGLKENGRYQVTEQTVSVLVSDEGGKIASFQALLLDEDGKPMKSATGEDISIRFEESGEALDNYLRENNGVITFTIPEGLDQQVRVVCSDSVLVEEQHVNEYNVLFSNVNVSTNKWLLFFSDKRVIYAIAIGIGIVVAGIVALIVVKKRKKVKKENPLENVLK